MNKVTIRSNFVRSELSYKLDVMREGFDAGGTVLSGYMAESYGFQTLAELEALDSKLKAPHLILTDRERACLKGELQNLLDIAEDNIGPDAPEYARDAAKLRGALAKL